MNNSSDSNNNFAETFLKDFSRLYEKFVGSNSKYVTIKISLENLSYLVEVLMKQNKVFPKEYFDYEEVYEGIKCSGCGREIDEYDEYCKSCGHPIDWDKYDENSEERQAFLEFLAEYTEALDKQLKDE